MKTLALRIYLAVVAVLMLFALVTGWLAQRNFEREREHLIALQSTAQASARDRVEAWVELIENSLPEVGVDEAVQRDALLDWSQRLRLPMALDNTQGLRIATSPLLTDRLAREPDHADRLYRAVLADGRVLWLWRPGFGPRARLNGPPPPLSDWAASSP
jgi:hypothetical protein